MNTGLKKLVEATESVNVLSKELEVKEKELAVASKKTDQVSKTNSLLFDNSKRFLYTLDL